ncbi:MAG: HRDC domain-containing protein [Pseudomonadales bacterium]|nr:HRDC domain-containing protein [Pseudomonadales bacterium]
MNESHECRLAGHTDGDAITLVDPFCVQDWSPFIELLSNPDLLWVMHSGSEDLVLLLSVFEIVPKKIFDTQAAAAYAGLGFSLSYQALVKSLLNTDVAKGETRSDWLRRPLSDAQLEYAASDVRHLITLYQTLEQKLRSSALIDWLAEDMRELVAGVYDIEDPDIWKTLYAGISNSWKLSDQGLALLQTLCVWREKESRARNKPRNWIAKDNELFAIADEFSSHGVIESDALLAMKEVSKEVKRKHGKAIIDALNQSTETGDIDRDLLNPPLHPKYRDTLKSWRKIVLSKADELNIAPELLARKRWLQDLVKSYEQSGQLVWNSPLKGWRQQALQVEFERALGGN